MKIAFMFPKDSPFMAWSSGRGIQDTLFLLGHKVTSIEMPIYPREIDPRVVDHHRRIMPTTEELAAHDAILISGPEHVAPAVAEIWGRLEWRQELCEKMPVGAWLHESMSRDDYEIDFDMISWCARSWFLPGIQDADWLDQEAMAKDRAFYMPFAVDTNLFKPDASIEKEFPVAFIGGLYPKRQVFLRALKQQNMPTFRTGQVTIQDLHGYANLESIKRYILNVQQCGTFMNLPALSRLMVMKVFEVLACGTFLMTPLPDGQAGVRKNAEIFRDGEHLEYFTASNLPSIARRMTYWCEAEHAAEREAIAKAGCEEVHAKHSLMERLPVILEKMGCRKEVLQ